MPRGYPELDVMRHNIQDFKEKRRITNQTLAHDLDVSTSHISRVLSGETVPSLQFLIDLSHYMGVTLASLFTDEKAAHVPHSIDVRVFLRVLFSEMGFSTGKTAQAVEYISNLEDSRD